MNQTMKPPAPVARHGAAPVLVAAPAVDSVRRAAGLLIEARRAAGNMAPENAGLAGSHDNPGPVDRAVAALRRLDYATAGRELQTVISLACMPTPRTADSCATSSRRAWAQGQRDQLLQAARRAHRLIAPVQPG